ncbi:unnamed protein product [Cuscuta campestris]|uniref:Reverse transcriptase domain-containing protein n=1 Tax=Cuscuta campestris TaxID=132261 RepID=A0A484NN26_9ASTE|nr:unnamed protein product [Cuscuta campestris]
MLGLGFPLKFVGLIMECINSASSSISVNGNTHGFFKIRRGLRQGDPMAPTLFIFCIEYLSRLLNTKTKEGSFHFHKNCSELGISHLAFADDILLFVRGMLVRISSNWLTSLEVNFLSELIRAVIQGVESFWLQAFPNQKTVLNRITTLCRDFLWGSKFAKVAWADICKPINEGGLGLRDAETWNNALLCKA